MSGIDEVLGGLIGPVEIGRTHGAEPHQWINAIGQDQRQIVIQDPLRDGLIGVDASQDNAIGPGL